jgi:hypothetical protein
MVSNASLIGGEFKLSTNGNIGVLYNPDRSGSLRDQAMVMSDSIENGKGINIGSSGTFSVTIRILPQLLWRPS